LREVYKNFHGKKRESVEDEIHLGHP
jgi:hypothetical protein